jgi:hypothetical protein
MVLFFIVGLTFALVGLLIVYLAIYYRIHGHSHEGNIYAIEEYISDQREEGVDRKIFLYRPVFKYKFSNKIYYFSGGGSNIINKKIGEKINVYVLISKGPEYCKADISFNVWFGLIFFFIGLLSIIFFFLKGDFHISTMSLFFYTFAFLSILTMFTKIMKSKENIFDQFLKNSQMIAQEDLENLNLMKSEEELEQFINHRNKMGLYFTTSTALLFIGLSFFLWNEVLTDDFKLDVSKVISSLDFNALLTSMQNNPTFLGVTIFSLFGLIAFLSSLQLYFKTYNK